MEGEIKRKGRKNEEFKGMKEKKGGKERKEDKWKKYKDKEKTEIEREGIRGNMKSEIKKKEGENEKI